MRGFWLFFSLLILSLIGMALGVVAAYYKFGRSGFLVGLIAYMIFLIVMDLTTGVIFYTYATLTPKHSDKDVKD